MNATLARLLVRLYPRTWRERYAVEFEAFLQNGPGGLLAFSDVLWSALHEHLSPARPARIDTTSRLHTLCVRAPWTIFGLAPVLLLMIAYAMAGLYLWVGWRVFLPGAYTPFGHSHGPIWAAQNLYFQAGRIFYFAAPVLLGWAAEVVVVRQRVRPVWLVISLSLLAWFGSTIHIQAARTAASGGFDRVSMDLPWDTSLHAIYESPFHLLAILSLSVLPYLVWRLKHLSCGFSAAPRS